MDRVSESAARGGSVLRACRLYLGDNGRAFCGAPRCAGVTASITGRDLSGQRVAEVSEKDARRYGLRCETCGGGVLS